MTSPPPFEPPRSDPPPSDPPPSDPPPSDPQPYGQQGPPPPGPQWMAPAPPPPQVHPDDSSIVGRRVAGGIGLAILAHLLSIALIVGAIPLLTAVMTETATDSELGPWFGTWLAVAALLQLLVFVGCMVFGIRGIRRGDRGRGLGLLIGWAVGVIVLPVVGFGVCAALLSF